eukprot:3004509-Rhodomonas_salina.1
MRAASPSQRDSEPEPEALPLSGWASLSLREPTPRNQIQETAMSVHFEQRAVIRHVTTLGHGRDVDTPVCR